MTNQQIDEMIKMKEVMSHMKALLTVIGNDEEANISSHIKNEIEKAKEEYGKII